MRDVQTQEIASQQYRYYLKWHYPAVRVALLAFPLQRGQEDAFAQRMDPALSRTELDEAIQVLQELNLAQWTCDGILEPMSPFLTTGDRWKDQAVKGFQDQTLELARRSLTAHSPTCREVSTLTLAIPESEIPTLQEMVKDFRQRVLQWTASLEEADAVMQVNVATFPLTRLAKAGR